MQVFYLFFLFGKGSHMVEIGGLKSCKFLYEQVVLFIGLCCKFTKAVIKFVRINGGYIRVKPHANYIIVVGKPGIIEVEIHLKEPPHHGDI